MREPFTQAEIVAALGQTQAEVGAFFAELSPEQFMHGNAETWSPAHHLHHLIVSNQPVASALALPRDRLPARNATQPSRSYSDIRALYREVLATGVKASGRFLPDPQGTQAELLTEFRQTLDTLQAKLQGWNDVDLDAYTLAHPVLGPLSVREMLLFTLYHNAHHLAGVQNKTQMENA
ncbi:DinB family protein [Deinococcus sp. Arct2-2]|uniref:DinB family protein n=1 Tax=Deinococcus sp. Arct2-2 TaxID=2568653 RepID=UPI0010A50A4E|nr:DinB family protein [Deinococcus sp. Arct2-2]THF69769.1 DinB family protein [Deinococcus sp. Arct2-2]